MKIQMTKDEFKYMLAAADCGMPVIRPVRGPETKTEISSWTYNHYLGEPALFNWKMGEHIEMSIEIVEDD